MKKAIFMGIVFLVLAFGSTSYMNYLNSGEMVLPFSHLFKGFSAESVVDGLKDKASSAAEDVNVGGKLKSDTQQVYKWQDANGQWHYGNKAPEEVANAKSVIINKNQNIIDSVKVPEPKEKAVQTNNNAVGIKKPNPYSPAQVKKTIDDAKNVQNMLDERLELQQKALKGLN